MLLTGVMSKMGVYGFLRILLPIFPEQMHALLTPLLWLAVITIVFSAGAAFAQRDLKRILAYSSINHLGYCLLGIFAVVSFQRPDDRAVDRKDGGVERRDAADVQSRPHGGDVVLVRRVPGAAQPGDCAGLDDFGGLRKWRPSFAG